MGTRAVGVFVAAFLSACSFSGLDERPGRSGATSEPDEDRDGQPRAGEPATITVASYNVFYEAPGAPSTLERIATIDADVIVFQETNDGWRDAIVSRIGGRFPACRFEPPRRYLPSGLGVCSKTAILETEVIDSPVEWFPALRAVIETSRGPVEILDVHLRPAVADSDRWWEESRATRALRRREMSAYLARLAPELPSLVVGDLNDVRGSDVLRTLDRAGFDSALLRLRNESVTWRWAGVSPPLEAQLDHVLFARERFDVLRAEVLPGGGSDHDAVLVTLAFR